MFSSRSSDADLIQDVDLMAISFILEISIISFYSFLNVLIPIFSHINNSVISPGHKGSMVWGAVPSTMYLCIII